MDRRTVEPNRALLQRLASIEKRLRFLQRRVRYSGRVQYARELSVITSNSTPAGGVVALSLSLDPGAWRVDGRAQTIPPTSCELNMIPWAYDHNGDEMDELNGMNSLGYAAFFTPAAGTTLFPFTVGGVGIWPNGGRVDLQLHADGGALPNVIWSNIWLIATPI